MRILLVIEAAGGGSGRHVIDLARELARQGHHVAVIYSPTRAESRFEAEIAALPIVLARLPMRRAVGPWDIPTARAMKRLVAQLGPFDIVHAHSSKAGALLRAVAPKGAARVYTPHAFRTMDPGLGGAGRVAYGVVEALLARFCTDALIAVAPEEAAHARNLGISARKIHTVVNGVSPAPPVNRVEARAELGLAPDDIAVGFVGRLCEQKDPERFARAIRIARAADPRIRGVVLGDGELAEGVRRAGGDGVALFKGRDARLFLPAFDLFAMTSRYEGMPYVLLEALQAGLPIVSTEVGGTSVASRWSKRPVGACGRHRRGLRRPAVEDDRPGHARGHGVGVGETGQDRHRRDDGGRDKGDLRHGATRCAFSRSARAGVSVG